MAQLTSDKSRTAAHRFYGRLGCRASHEGSERRSEDPGPLRFRRPAGVEQGPDRADHPAVSRSPRLS